LVPALLNIFNIPTGIVCSGYFWVGLTRTHRRDTYKYLMGEESGNIFAELIGWDIERIYICPFEWGYNICLL
jgi:hypothetical protein